MAKEKLLDLDVSFGNINFGDETVKVGVSTSRAGLTPSQADKNLCCRRLTGTIQFRATGQANQASLPGMEAEDGKVTGVFDVKAISMKSKTFGFGLTFVLGSLTHEQRETLQRFAKKEGKLSITNVEAIPEPEKSEPDADEENDEDDDKE